ncbi:MAG: hypothetical protein AMJ81_10615 [Phycisphaerae bacterium SM23_33]|nr:MAG: hypothetical protein AMJ81_10615 [Phycisphaerae bacterium SM23_33]
MTSLSEYLDTEMLNELASRFSDAVGGKVRILSADGSLLAGQGPQGPPSAQAKVLLDGGHIGTIALDGPGVQPPAAESVRLLGLMQDVLTRLCRQARQLRDRVEELAAMYRLTEVFTGRTDLKQVHQLVAETMVKATGADACSIRVLNEERTELMTIAVHGLSEEYMSKGPILLADSQIDQEILASGKCVYIPDERTDPRVLYKTEARREGIVSALCAPMTYKGRLEGIIRVYTRRPHEFDWFETSLVGGVAAQAASAIVNARLYNEALEAERIRRQLRLAAEVQRRMIPPQAPRVEGLEISGIYEPCFELGGDFYDFIELPKGNLGVCVGDVVGKGVPASLLMALVRSSLRAHVAHVYELSEVLAAVNLDLWRQSDERDFATMFYGVLDVPGRRLTYCSAGHEPALLVREGRGTWLAGSGGVLGIDPAMRYRNQVLGLRRGDLLLIFTDGLPEATNFKHETFTRDRVRAAALEACRRGESAEGVGKHLLWEVRRFAGLQTRSDDLTLVAIKVQ